MITLTEIRRGFPPTVGASGRRVGWCLVLAVLAPWVARAQPGPGDRDDLFEFDSESEKVLVVPVTEPIDGQAAESLRSRIASRLEDPAFRTIIFRFDAGSTDTAACEQLAEFVERQDRDARTTVAWIRDTQEPIGAAVLPVFACRKIVFGRDAVLAALPQRPADGGEEIEFPRSFGQKLERYARRRVRPEILARALVDRDHDDILRVVYRKRDGAGAPEDRGAWPEKGGGEVKFMTRSEFDQLPLKERQFEVTFDEVICEGRTALRMNAKQARDWKFTDTGSASDIHDVVIGLGLNVPPSRVFDLEQGALVPSSRAGQAIIDFFNSPIVRTFLILGGCLGLLLELKMLGTMIPGLSGLACFILLFATSLFPVTGSTVGTATAFEILIFFIGLGLMAVEFLLLPGVAVFALGGGALCLVSLVLVMVPPGSSSGALSGQMTVKDAMLTLLFGFGTGTVAFALLLRFLPRWGALRHGGLVNQTSIEGVPTADSAVAAQIQTSELLGQTGVAETTLRPAGKVLLDNGRFLDVVTDGEFVEKGERVVVTGGTATRITVARTLDTETGTGQD